MCRLSLPEKTPSDLMTHPTYSDDAVTSATDQRDNDKTNNVRFANVNPLLTSESWNTLYKNATCSHNHNIRPCVCNSKLIIMWSICGEIAYKYAHIFFQPFYADGKREG